MEHKQIGTVSELPAHLHRAYKAARSVGMDCTVYTVRDETVLYANGRMFDPEERSMDAFELATRITRQRGGIRMLMDDEGIIVQLTLADGQQITRYYRTVTQPERALRKCIASCFEDLYDYQGSHSTA